MSSTLRSPISHTAASGVGLPQRRAKGSNTATATPSRRSALRVDCMDPDVARHAGGKLVACATDIIVPKSLNTAVQNNLGVTCSLQRRIHYLKRRRTIEGWDA